MKKHIDRTSSKTYCGRRSGTPGGKIFPGVFAVPLRKFLRRYEWEEDPLDRASTCRTCAAAVRRAIKDGEIIVGEIEASSMGPSWIRVPGKTSDGREVVRRFWKSDFDLNTYGKDQQRPQEVFRVKNYVLIRRWRKHPNRDVFRYTIRVLNPAERLET